MALEDPAVASESLLGSVKSHIEDRLRSPFAGAFLVAWVFVNWKALLILAWSSSSIERRVDDVSLSHFSQTQVLWIPLFYASVGLIAYYLLSAFFLAVFEIYGMARRAIERKFDHHRWVSPEAYIELKKKTRTQVKELTDLASDGLGRIDSLQSDLAAASAEKLELEAKLSEQSAISRDEKLKATGLAGEVKRMAADAADTAATIDSASRRIAALEAALSDLEVAAERVLAPIKKDRARQHMTAMDELLKSEAPRSAAQQLASFDRGTAQMLDALDGAIRNSKIIREPF